MSYILIYLVWLSIANFLVMRWADNVVKVVVFAFAVAFISCAAYQCANYVINGLDPFIEIAVAIQVVIGIVFSLVFGSIFLRWKVAKQNAPRGPEDK